jgi:hypothetical protein
MFCLIGSSFAGESEVVKAALEQGMVVHICNPSPQWLRQEDPEFETSLGYILSKIHLKKPFLKKQLWCKYFNISSGS